MSNWYVIQVRGGYEEKIVRQCKLLINPEVLEECFIPKYKKLIKKEGKWNEKEEILFKGYLFLISDQVNELFLELKKIPDLTKMLGKVDREIYPIYDQEVEFLKTFGKQEHVVDMSVGYITGDKIVVSDGPLKGKEGCIKKIDRHKRIAFIEVEFLGEVREAKVGLEIITKNN
ncbi:MAG: antiterminator LoaP [Erysipelotrichaceae bacterium]